MPVDLAAGLHRTLKTLTFTRLCLPCLLLDLYIICLYGVALEATFLYRRGGAGSSSLLTPWFLRLISPCRGLAAPLPRRLHRDAAVDPTELRAQVTSGGSSRLFYL